jgi:hypothetical protein
MARRRSLRVAPSDGDLSEMIATQSIALADLFDRLLDRLDVPRLELLPRKSKKKCLPNNVIPFRPSRKRSTTVSS